MVDALTASNLENTLRFEEKPVDTSEKDWEKMNRTACDLIRSCLTQDIKYHVLYETVIAPKEEALPLLAEERTLH